MLVDIGQLTVSDYYPLLLQTLHPFNGLFSRTTWVSRHQKPFSILMKQETMGWQWHQLDHMQIICTSLQYLATQFLWVRCPSATQPTGWKHWRHSFRHMVLHSSSVAKSSTSTGWGKSGNVTSAGWQV